MRTAWVFFWIVLVSNLPACATISGWSSVDIYGDKAAPIDVLCETLEPTPDWLFTHLRGRMAPRSLNQPDGADFLGSLTFENQHASSSVVPSKTVVVSGVRLSSTNQDSFEMKATDADPEFDWIKLSARGPAASTVVYKARSVGMKCTFAQFSEVSTTSIPTCNAAGTPSAGWYLNGRVIRYEACEHKVAACSIDPVNGEGWKVFSRGSETLLEPTSCLRTKSKPECQNLGTPTQGWYRNGHLIALDATCHLRAVACVRGKTSSEGWQTFEPKDAQLLAATPCTRRGSSARPSRAAKLLPPHKAVDLSR